MPARSGRSIEFRIRAYLPRLRPRPERNFADELIELDQSVLL